MPDLPEKPLNREPPIQDLTSTFLTPPDSAYDRNHGVLAYLNADTHRVRVDGNVNQTLDLSLSDLHSFPQADVTCALQCAGNRRHTMRTKIREVQGLNWKDGAIMNCRWTGPRLRDVLSRAGIALNDEEKGELAHVAFACHTAPCEAETWYGASIPLSRALREDGEVLLATAMNGAPLPPNHGFPVRVVAPGIAGARAVKWVDRITVQRGESENVYMQRDYKVLPPEVRDSQQAEGYWGITPPVQEMPVNSAISVPVEGGVAERGEDGCVGVVGYAVPSGDEGPVTRVEVSADGGQRWTEAELVRYPEEEEGKWAWKLWRARVPVPQGRGKTTVYSRATDKAGNTQPERSQWNLRGVCYNGYGEAANVMIK
ncbi:sulfite oxidase-like protein [Hortaea werneckii]|nr:sulfite oxidase-like protein [Hortaea werneckii]